MIKLIMHGCNGAMGQVISGLVENDEEISIVAGIDIADNKKNPYPVFASLQECDVEADVVIGVPDSGLDAALGYSEASGIPYSELIDDLIALALEA